MRPNFIIIGAARCATTSLHKYLSDHPDVFLSEPKEINYFSNKRYFERGEEWYLEHFRNANCKAIGEASTSYTSAPNIPNVPERIVELLGNNIKLIYIVRHPIDRLLSHYTHYISRGRDIDALDDLIKSKTHSLIHQGLYTSQIERYLQHFAKENIHVLSVDGLLSKPSQTMSEIFNFLEIDDSVQIENLQEKHNNNDRVIQKTRFGRFLLQNYNSRFEHLPQPYIFKKIVNSIAEVGGKEFAKLILTPEQLADLNDYYGEELKKFEEDWNITLNSKYRQ